jgi:natural product biosynthesis luciferase-like monooxygenase protein
MLRNAMTSPMGAHKSIDFGLFYWNVANSEQDGDAQKYRLLIESAKFADSHGFNAVWTPERHFEDFGGLFPNPAVVSAALAMITKNVQLRAGSCVVPLHSPIRIAEDWSVVDNLSNGRVAISVASGWAAPDFAIKPENFANAKQVMFESTELVRRLWRGEKVSFPGPKGEIRVGTLPRPIQKELPLWVTTAGNVDTYIQAGKTGANVLTHLLGQTLEDVADRVAAYRKAWVEAGHAGQGIVTVMLHTLVGKDLQSIEAIVRQPLKEYLRSAIFLVKAAAWQFPTFKKLSEEQGKSLDDFFVDISNADMDELLEFAFQRYFRTSGLFGSPETCLELIHRVSSADVDEIACLIDFGVETDVVLDHLPYLDNLRELAQQRQAAPSDFSLVKLLSDYSITHFQCTPSMASMLVADTDSHAGLARLKHFLVGGESLTPVLARSLSDLVSGQISNMYGPTETTIWSTAETVGNNSTTPSGSISIGSPLRRQSVNVLDANQQRLPPGLVGEIVIGGLGVTRGYWNKPEQTKEKFVSDPAGYRTGDLGRWLPDGRLEFLGRRDQQVKVRGHRIELGEIEALLQEQITVAEAAVIVREDTPGDRRIVAYVRINGGHEDYEATLLEALQKRLPDFMVPSAIVAVKYMPLTPNGKLDRNALPDPSKSKLSSADRSAGSAGDGPRATEGLILGIWKEALGRSEIGNRDNFFDLGGHSLLVIQVLKELRERHSPSVQMVDLFQHTTIESLARFLDGGIDPVSPSQRGKGRAEGRRAVLGRRPQTN